MQGIDDELSLLIDQGISASELIDVKTRRAILLLIWKVQHLG